MPTHVGKKRDVRLCPSVVEDETRTRRCSTDCHEEKDTGAWDVGSADVELGLVFLQRDGVDTRASMLRFV